MAYDQDAVREAYWKGDYQGCIVCRWKAQKRSGLGVGATFQEFLELDSYLASLVRDSVPCTDHAIGLAATLLRMDGGA